MMAAADGSVPRHASHNGAGKHKNGYTSYTSNGIAERVPAYIEEGSRVIRDIYREEFGHFHEELHNEHVASEMDEMVAVADAVEQQQGPESLAGSTERCSLLTQALTSLGLYVLMFLGFLSQLLFKPKVATEKNRQGYAPLYEPFETFYSRYVYRRVRHCFNRPIASAPAATLLLEERRTSDHNWTFHRTGRTRPCLNLGSYNYLGFAGAGGEGGARAAAVAARRYGVSTCSARGERGGTRLHAALERAVAAWVGAEDAAVCGMGFATNALTLPALVGGRGALVLSDRNNHASLILGLRLARVEVRVFEHNDLQQLERMARAALAERAWTNVVVVVEGVYSMEGSVAPLADLVALKKRLGLRLYLDEAHSAGALGAHGRGVPEHARVAPGDVDVLMGTFTKSFGAAGGYIAGSRRLVQWVRAHGHAHAYAHAMAPPVAAQVLWSLRALSCGAGHARVRRLRANARYFRARLACMGALVLGHRASPVVPMLVYSFSKMQAVVERLTHAGVAAVGVGFPATPLGQARIRFCLSAAHSREQLDAALAAIERAADELGLRYSRHTPPLLPPAPHHHASAAR